MKVKLPSDPPGGYGKMPLSAPAPRGRFDGMDRTSLPQTSPAQLANVQQVSGVDGSAQESGTADSDVNAQP